MFLKSFFVFLCVTGLNGLKNKHKILCKNWPYIVFIKTIFQRAGLFQGFNVEMDTTTKNRMNLSHQVPGDPH